MKDKILTFFCNLIWFLSSLSEWVKFILFSNFVKISQIKILNNIIENNKNTQYFENQNIEKINVENYDKFKLSEYTGIKSYINNIMLGGNKELTNEKIFLFEPTSGSTGFTKYIPYTKGLQNEFLKAIKPWIFDIFIKRPQIFWGKHYWSISPVTPDEQIKKSKVPIGFNCDEEYLGRIGKIITDTLFVVPKELKEVKNIEQFQYLTLLFLLKEKNLRILSIWNPTFLLILLDKIKKHKKQIINDIKTGQLNKDLGLDEKLYNILNNKLSPNAKRSDYLYKILNSDNMDYQKIWPSLKIISTWGDANSIIFFNKLASMFPNTFIQKKGLIATEAIVSIPFGKNNKHVLAYRSHFFEFEDINTGKIYNLWQLQISKKYKTIITTSGGLYRYELNDLVEVTEKYNNIPVIKFLGKTNKVSDYVGEKLNENDVNTVFNKLHEKYPGSFDFLLLAPFRNKNNYIYHLYVECNDINLFIKNKNKIEKLLDDNLSKNYHYRHARNIGQLEKLKLFLLKKNKGYEGYQNFYLSKGMKLGDIKSFCLCHEIGIEKYYKKNLLTIKSEKNKVR